MAKNIIVSLLLLLLYGCTRDIDLNELNRNFPDREKASKKEREDIEIWDRERWKRYNELDKQFRQLKNKNN